VKNLVHAREILRSLARAGVREIVVCAGARNSPFVAVLSAVSDLKVYNFFEERSAGFFAIGRMQASGHPVAVCTTSGTAVAELLPAVIEADYQGLPLVVLSADRPVSYRGSGAPQTIVQPGIFSHYVERGWDLTTPVSSNGNSGSDGSVADFSPELGQRPVHVNVCFDEPLIDGAVEEWSAGLRNDAIAPKTRPRPCNGSIGVKKPLVIAGRLSAMEAALLAPVLARWQRPVYLEGLSQLRGHSELAHLEIRGGEEIFRQMDFDGVIRVGGVPTLRFWRDLENSHLPVWHFSRQPWSGLPREKTVHNLSALADGLLPGAGQFEAWTDSERDLDRQREKILDDLISEFPLSECAWVRRVSEWIAASADGAKSATLFLGNSLPIREWDLAAQRRSGAEPSHRLEVFGNRGTNGIDGLVSTFLGVAHEGKSNWALIGDLSALYDLSGPWALRQRPVSDINLAVINNGGGKIFTRIFKNSLFENAHDLNFGHWAKMWNWNYRKLSGAGDRPDHSKGPRILEIVPDPGHTEAFNNAWEKQQC